MHKPDAVSAFPLFLFGGYGNYPRLKPDLSLFLPEMHTGNLFGKKRQRKGMTVKHMHLLLNSASNGVAQAQEPQLRYHIPWNSKVPHQTSGSWWDV
jgi:hypothetical protein